MKQPDDLIRNWNLNLDLTPPLVIFPASILMNKVLTGLCICEEIMTQRGLMTLLATSWCSGLEPRSALLSLFALLM